MGGAGRAAAVITCLYAAIFNESGEGGGREVIRVGNRWGGGPGSVIYRVSYVNIDRNFNKLYFKHVSA